MPVQLQPTRTLLLAALVLALVIVPFLVFGDRIEAWSHAALLDRRPAGALPSVLCVALLAGAVATDVLDSRQP